MLDLPYIEMIRVLAVARVENSIYQAIGRSEPCPPNLDHLYKAAVDSQVEYITRVLELVHALKPESEDK